MKKNQHKRRKALRRRRGMVSIEVALSIGVMVPIVGALLLGGTKMCFILYQTINTLVSWPFL